MKKLLVFMIMSLMLAASVSALSIGRVRHVDDFFHININNPGTQEIEDLNVRVIIPELGLAFRGNDFDIDGGDSTGRFIIMDHPVKQEYLVRITVSNDDIRRVKHTFIMI